MRRTFRQVRAEERAKVRVEAELKASRDRGVTPDDLADACDAINAEREAILYAAVEEALAA